MKFLLLSPEFYINHPSLFQVFFSQMWLDDFQTGGANNYYSFICSDFPLDWALLSRKIEAPVTRRQLIMDCNAPSLTSKFDSGVVVAEPQRKSGSLPLITKRRKNRKGASSHFLVEAMGCVITRVLDETSGALQPSFQCCIHTQLWPFDPSQSKLDLAGILIVLNQFKTFNCSTVRTRERGSLVCVSQLSSFEIETWPLV